MFQSRRRALVVAVAALTVGGGLVAAASSADAAGSTVYLSAKRTCATTAASHHATCFAMKLVRSRTKTAGAVAEKVSPSAVLPQGPSGGYTPGDIATAYGFKTTAAVPAGQLVAIVDAYNNQHIQTDLATFDSQYGLKAETAASFKVVNQTGGTTLPANNTGWAGEEDLDVQTVRGLCNKCKIVLIEANDNSNANLDAAENEAVALGATVISNSFGGPEAGAISAADQNAYNHPGVAIVASTGDDGWYGEDVFNDGDATPAAPNTPSSLGTVIAAGGTTLNLNADGSRAAESVWNNNGPFDYFANQIGKSQGASGGGCSTQVTAPAWQSAIPGYSGLGCGTKRSTGDVAAVADPFTGYDIFVGSDGAWETYGGTSLSAPVISSMIALAGGAHGVSYPAQTIYSHYTTTPKATTPYNDITVGGNGACGPATTGNCLSYFGGNPNHVVGQLVDCNFANSTSTAVLANNGQCQAGVGYDGPTGVGSPKNLNLFKP